MRSSTKVALKMMLPERVGTLAVGNVHSKRVEKIK